MTVSVWSKIKPAHHNLVILATLIADSDNHVVDPYDSAEIVDMTENKLKNKLVFFVTSCLHGYWFQQLCS